MICVNDTLCSPSLYRMNSKVIILCTLSVLVMMMSSASGYDWDWESCTADWEYGSSWVNKLGYLVVDKNVSLPAMIKMHPS